MYKKTLSPAALMDLTSRIQGKILLNELLSRHTSIKTGGPAEALVIPSQEEDVPEILRFAASNSLPVHVIGNGTNLVVADDGLPGIVIKMVRQPGRIEVEGEQIRAGSGALLPTLATVAADHGLAGLEFAVGIPGALGGGIYMNAGTRQGEVGQVLTRVTWCDPAGADHTSSRAEMNFGYRTSSFQDGGRIILSAVLKLTPDKPDEVRRRMNEYLQYRRKTQPLTSPNIGSIFSNPPGDFAGRLIEAAGLKGHRLGGAQVSPMHANFIVNAGGATSADVTRLMKEIIDQVCKQFGVTLHPEVRFLGLAGL